MSHYIGKTISLISNKQLRYVGILESISAEDATIALKSVRSFGTEGRLAQAGSPHLEVAPGTDVYEYVAFKGDDVKDLSVLDIHLDQVKPEVYVPPAEPQQQANVPSATTAASNTQYPQPSPTQAPSQPSPASQTPVAPSAATQPRTQAPQEPSVPQASKTTETEAPSKTGPPAAAPGSRPSGNQSKKLEYTEDFDFESANAKFAKEMEHEREVSTYNKSSFFDTLSTSNDERNSMRWGEEKQLNYDTFGEASARGNRGGYRGRGRGRGRGGRGRGRGGRGRGSYEKKPEWA